MRPLQKVGEDLSDPTPFLLPRRTTMEKNVGGYDRIGRLVVGMVLLIVGIAGIAVGSAVNLAVGPIPQTVAAAILLLVGAILVVTGYLQQCPINSQLGINTLGGGRQ